MTSLSGAPHKPTACPKNRVRYTKPYSQDLRDRVITSGMLLGYAVYMFVHHATHHLAIQPGDWLYKGRLRHMAHHYHDNANFGVSTGFWDRVFNTTGARRDRFARI